MIWKLFAIDGKIPYVQIAIGILLGALGMYVYTTFVKPRMDANKGEIIRIDPKLAIKREKVAVPGQTSESGPAPVLLDVNKQFRNRNVQGMPRLPVILEPESESEDEDEDEDDEDEDEEDELVEDDEHMLDNENGIRIMTSGGALGNIDST